MDLTCSICLEEIININTKKTLSCEHMFHKECINKYLNNDYKCPLCKNKNDNTNIIIKNKSNNIFQKIEIKNNTIVNKLKKFFTNNQILEFLQHLNTNTIISGSFILSTILNENYSNTDIDIYVDNQFDYIRLIKFLVRSKYTLKGNILDNFSYNYLINNNLIIYVDTFIKTTNNNIKIDVIYCKNNIKVIENFDLDIVKNFYNGSNFYVYDLTKILYKTDHINESTITEIKQKRIIKYRNRGFNIDIINN